MCDFAGNIEQAFKALEKKRFFCLGQQKRAGYIYWMEKLHRPELLKIKDLGTKTF